MSKLAEEVNCTGCGACFSACPHAAISMRYDKDGFLVPFIHAEKCVECGLCSMSCPIITPKRQERLCNPIVYAAYHEDKGIRKQSSSGGLFSAISQILMGQGYCVAAAAFDEHLTLRHQFAYNLDEIKKMRGSKYVQSEIGTIYKEVRKKLINGERVLFVGTPCQVGGLYSYLRKDYNNLFTVDLICHGVPSPGLFRSYLNLIGIDTCKKWNNYLFRDFSSSGLFTSSVIDSKDRIKKIKISNHSYITAYLRGWLHRYSCYNCRFNGIPRQADITIGDFWGIISGKVSFHGERSQGISVLIINSLKGERITNDLKELVYMEEKHLEDAIINNHNLISSDRIPPERLYAYSEIASVPSRKFMRKHHLYLPHDTFKVKMKRVIKRVLGSN